jgi:hypothetical protein
MGRGVPITGTIPDNDGREAVTLNSAGIVVSDDGEDTLFDGGVTVGADTGDKGGAGGVVCSQVLVVVR